MTLSKNSLSKDQLLWDEKIVDYYEIGQSIRSLRARNPLIKIGFYCGDFDKLSPSDCVFYQMCRSECDLFVIGIQTDYSGRLNKKKFEFPMNERAFRMGSMVYVNYIVPFDEETNTLIVSSIDPDKIFYGRKYGDKEEYSPLVKNKLTFIDYPWKENEIKGVYFSI